MADRRGNLFLTISLIEKGKQCDNQAAEGNHQADDLDKYHNDICSGHEHHLLSYVFRKPGHKSGGYHPVMDTFCFSLYHICSSMTSLFFDFLILDFSGVSIQAALLPPSGCSKQPRLMLRRLHQQHISFAAASIEAPSSLRLSDDAVFYFVHLQKIAVFFLDHVAGVE